MAQNNNDSISFTNITTTDFMEGIGGGKINWRNMQSVQTAARWCILGKCKDESTGEVGCCKIRDLFYTIGQWGLAIWNGVKYVATSIASFFDGDGGGAGGNWSLNPPYATWGNYNGGGTPPNFVPPGGSGGGGSATTNNTNPLGNTTIPPPVKPEVDDEIPDSTASPKEDCAGVRNGTAYRDYCDSCVGGSTGKTACCPTDSNFQVTKNLLLHINPYGDKNRIDSVLKYINMYKDDPDFKLNTRLRLAHFLAQISAETEGFTIMVESHFYSKKALLKKKKYFDSATVDKYVNCVCLFDRWYCCNNLGLGNGSEATKDGSKYRGQGLIQLTGRSSYTEFTNYYQNKFNDQTVSFIDNPELLQNNMKYSVLAALWEVTQDKKLNKYADADNVLAYSKGINCGSATNKKCTPNHLDKRKSKLALAKQVLCL